MATAPAAALPMSLGIMKTLARRGPPVRNFSCSSSMVERPPMPEPMITPVRSGSAEIASSPASSTASVAAAMPIWAKTSVLRASLGSMYRVASKSVTSHAICTGSSDASKPFMGPAPERPSIRPSQNASTPMPIGVTTPTPVTTTSVIDSSSCLGLDELDGVADRLDVLELLVGDLDVEPVLEGPGELNGVQRVEVEVLLQPRLFAEAVDLVPSGLQLFFDGREHFLLLHDHCLLSDRLSGHPDFVVVEPFEVSARPHCSIPEPH